MHVRNVWRRDREDKDRVKRTEEVRPDRITTDISGIWLFTTVPNHSLAVATSSVFEPNTFHPDPEL